MHVRFGADKYLGDNVKCPVCGAHVEEGEEYCPNCGYDVHCIDEYE